MSLYVCFRVTLGRGVSLADLGGGAGMVVKAWMGVPGHQDYLDPR